MTFLLYLVEAQKIEQGENQNILFDPNSPNRV
jgi:hypothetical protein